MPYGVKIFGPGGVLRLDEDETFTRVVATVKRNFNFSGTVSVPDFDDTKGMFHVSYFINKFNDTSGKLADNKAPMVLLDKLTFEATSLPTLNWNNTTKLLAISPVVWPSGWTAINASDYLITFIHYR